MQGDVERVCHECRRRLSRVDVLQRSGVTHALSLQFDEALDLYRARANLAHRIRVQLEVAVMTRAQSVIGLLPSTISLIRRAAEASVGGNHGNWVQVSSCCRRLVSDMKSQTANTWVSIKRRSTSSVVISAKIG